MMDVLDGVRQAGACVRGRNLEAMQVLSVEAVSGQNLRHLKGGADGRTESHDGRNGGEEETSS